MPAAPVRTTLAVPRDHPAYEGHFPGHPILPAVVVLAEVVAAVAAATGTDARAWEISNAKFPAAVEPGMELTLAHEATASGNIAFEVRTAHAVVASGTLARHQP